MRSTWTILFLTLILCVSSIVVTILSEKSVKKWVKIAEAGKQSIVDRQSHELREKDRSLRFKDEEIALLKKKLEEKPVTVVFEEPATKPSEEP